MLVDAGRDLWMRKLHEQGTASSQEEDILAVNPPRDRALIEQAGPHDPSLFTFPLAGRSPVQAAGGEGWSG